MQLANYAYNHSLSGIHPVEKAFFATGTLVMVISLNSPPVSVAALVLMSVLLIGAVNVPWRLYLRLMRLPASFLLLSALGVAVTLAPLSATQVYGVTLGGKVLGITAQGLGTALGLLGRALAGVTCLYFLILTTPMTELLQLLRKLRFPPFFVELVSLIYRFLFLLMETAGQIRTAQSARLGYRDWRVAYRSLSQLTVALFVKSIHSARLAGQALESRGYTGEFKLLELDYKLSPGNILIILAVEFGLVALDLLTGGALS